MPATLRRRALLSFSLAGLLPPVVAQTAAPAKAQAEAQTEVQTRVQTEAHTQAAEDQALRAAIAGPQRSAANRQRDAARHPYETLRFFGLRPDMTVIELAPGGGWYTEILAPYLREHGRLIVAHHARDDADAGRRRARAAFDGKLAAAPAVYDHVQMATLPAGQDRFADVAPGAAMGVDMVLTFRNVHNWIEAGYLDASLRAFAAVLKTGGTLGVEDHRAVPARHWTTSSAAVTSPRR